MGLRNLRDKSARPDPNWLIVGSVIIVIIATTVGVAGAIAVLPVPILMGGIGLTALGMAFFLFWQHPAWALITIIISLPVYFYVAVSVGGFTVRVYNLLAILLLFILLLKRTGRIQTPLLWPVLVYLLMLGVSVPGSLDPITSLKYILFQGFGFILMWATYNLIRDEQDFEWYFYLLLLMGNIDVLLIITNTLAFVLGLPTFAPIAHTHVLPFGRPNLFLGEPDRTAEFHLILLLMILPLVLLIGKWKRKRYLSHPFILVSFVLNSYVVGVGLFRAAWAGVLVGGLAYVLVSFRSRLGWLGLWRLFPLLAGIVIVFGISLAIYPKFASVLVSRINEPIVMWRERRLEVQTDLSVNYKLLEMGLERPWFGWGIGVDEEVLDPSELFVYHMETIAEGYNRLIRMFYGAGVVGVFGFIVWQLGYIKRLLKVQGSFAFKMAMLLPVVGIYWGHDMFRMVQFVPSLFLVMGLGLAWVKFASAKSQGLEGNMLSDKVQREVQQ